VGRERRGQWARTALQLRAALALLRPSIEPDSTRSAEEYLDHNELGLALDTLVEAALASDADRLPEGTVEHLRTASAEMDGYQPDAWDEFISRFVGHS
jgi:hypothetical protein